jgi:hypothetical protein
MVRNFDDLRYMIVLVSEVDQIDFNQVFETAPDTLRVSVDGLKTFFKWEGEIPSSVSNLTYKEGPYTHTEILNLLNSTEWVSNPNTP